MKTPVSEEIETLYDIVLDLLKSDPRYRDSDKMLSVRVWATQMGGVEKTRKVSAFAFFSEYCSDNSELHSQESIGRARRKIQEQYVELRGVNYRDRHDHQQDVKHVIRELDKQ